jgi:hypothetical protein
MAGYKIDLPYSGKAAGLYETALSEFLVGKPMPTSASITFHITKGGGQMRSRQINWSSGASVAEVARRIAAKIAETCSSTGRVLTGATVEFQA